MEIKADDLLAEEAFFRKVGALRILERGLKKRGYSGIHDEGIDSKEKAYINRLLKEIAAYKKENPDIDESF